MATEDLSPNTSPKSNDLRNRILFTVFILCIYRLGTFIPLAGIDPFALQEMMASLNDQMSSLRMFSQGF